MLEDAPSNTFRDHSLAFPSIFSASEEYEYQMVCSDRVYRHRPGFISLFQKHLPLGYTAFRNTAGLSKEVMAIFPLLT
jgi:hypothetical protein